MRIFLKTLLLAATVVAGLSLGAAEAPARAETMAEKTLKDIVARQRDLLHQSEKLAALGALVGYLYMIRRVGGWFSRMIDDIVAKNRRLFRKRK